MKLSTPPVGVTTVVTGLDGRLVDVGPRTDAGFVVVHIGEISEAEGAAGLPAICGAEAVARDGPRDDIPATTATAATSGATSVHFEDPIRDARPPVHSIGCRSAGPGVT